MWRAISRKKKEEEVSILIPAYQAADFIDRTLFLARGQTHQNLKILVSIDVSSDDTVSRVARHVADDPRVRLLRQDQRLGWVGNINYLLERVDSPYFFIYFHDDIILPQYTQVLLDSLLENSSCTSVHCDMGHFGTQKKDSPGRPMQQPTVHRLLDFMLHPLRSSPLRSMIRSDGGSHLRLPSGTVHGLWANEPFLLDLFAAGAAAHVEETLYYRWDQREGGLTEGWRSLPTEDIVKGWRSVVDQCILVFRRVTTEAREMEQLIFALYLKMYWNISQFKDGDGRRVFQHAGDFHPVFANLDNIPDYSGFGETLADWVTTRWASFHPDSTHL